MDVLLTVPQLQLPALFEDLRDRGFDLDPATVIEAFVRHHICWFDYHGVRVDWLKPALPLCQHVWDRADVAEEFGRPIRVATAEGLILLKLIASRTQDVVDVEALLAANRGGFDLAWVESEWTTLFHTVDPRRLRFRRAVAEDYESPRR